MQKVFLNDRRHLACPAVRLNPSLLLTNIDAVKREKHGNEGEPGDGTLSEEKAPFDEASPWLRAVIENAHGMLSKLEMGESNSIIVR
jgi:hypothetical protein